MEDTLRAEEARRRQEKAPDRGTGEVSGKGPRAKITRLAKALKRERRVLRRYRAEVTIGHCTEVVKRIRTGEAPDGTDTYRDDRHGVDLWLCAIRWPDTAHEQVWMRKLDIAFSEGRYCLLEAMFQSNAEPGERSDDPHRDVRKKSARETYGVTLKPIGADIGAVLEKVAKEFAGTDSDNLYSFSELTVAKPKSVVRQGFFKRKWDL